jgi:hypothetical protein
MTPTTEIQPFDFEAAAIREAGLALATQAEALVITDDETDAGAKTVLAYVTKGLKQAKARHDEVKAEPLAKCNAIDAAFNDAYEPFKTAKATIGAKAGIYFAAKKAAEEAARREAERIEREALVARAKAEAEAAAAAKRGEEPVPAPEPVQVASVVPIPVAQAVTKTEAGTVGMVEHRDWDVADEALIPRKYFILDTARIGKEIRAGDEIRGIRVVITYTTRTH